VHAKADHADDHNRHQRNRRADDHLHPLALPTRGNREERQQQPGGDLHADADRQRAGAGAQTRARRRAQRQGERNRQQHQCVVMRAADRQHQHHRVQPHERRRPRRRLTQPPSRTCDQRNRAEARSDSDRLERPQPAGQAQRRDRVAGEREHRPVRRIQERPPDELERRVKRRFSGHMRVRVQPVQRAHARKRQIAEHILREQRWPQQQDHVRQHDRPRERRNRQSLRRQQHEHVARAHDQHQRLEGASAHTHVEAPQWPCQPPRPAAAAARHIRRGCRCRTRAHQEYRHQDAQQPKPAKGKHDAYGPPRSRRCACLLGCLPGAANRGYGGGSGYEAHCYVSPSYECPALPVPCNCSHASGGDYAWAIGCT
jgi:hypothetical protein